MKHTLTIEAFCGNDFLIIEENEENNNTTIRIVKEDHSDDSVEKLQCILSKKELRSFIGALLHVQSKMK